MLTTFNVTNASPRTRFGVTEKFSRLFEPITNPSAFRQQPMVGYYPATKPKMGKRFTALA